MKIIKTINLRFITIQQQLTVLYGKFRGLKLASIAVQWLVAKTTSLGGPMAAFWS